jgi:ATP adenylyltransferase
MPFMAKKSGSPQRRRNLWAPWRTEYLQSLSDGDGGCFLCRYRDEPRRDRKNLVLWRGQRSLTVLNRFPYTGGHCLVAPLEHVGGLGDVGQPALLEMLAMIRDVPTILAKAIGAEGFNIGINLGRCAGAGLPGHLHVHVVPRWGGDTNFMSVLDDVRVIPQSLESLWDLLRKAAGKLHLPRLPEGIGDDP